MSVFLNASQTAISHFDSATGFKRWILAGFKSSEGAPHSNAGVRSMSLGITPLLTRLNIPYFISKSLIGGGSAAYVPSNSP